MLLVLERRVPDEVCSVIPIVAQSYIYATFWPPVCSNVLISTTASYKNSNSTLTTQVDALLADLRIFSVSKDTEIVLQAT